MRRTILLAIVLIALVFPVRAHAYIDPGSGAMSLQFLLAFIVGGLFWFRERLKLLIQRMKSLFSRKK